MEATKLEGTCPHCLSTLQPRPKRKKKCPHCGEYVYVRRGELVKEPENPVSLISPQPISANGDPRNQEKGGNLFDDLDRYYDEFYTKGDLEAGRKILIEVVGVAVLGGALLTALTSWLPPLGITLGAATVAQVMYYAATAYVDLDEDERKYVRAVVSWIKGGFKLGDKLLKE